MSDLLDELRAVENWFEADNDICQRAADEIETLRAQLASARKVLEITKKMIEGTMVKFAVIDVQTMQTLGGVIDTALKTAQGKQE